MPDSIHVRLFRSSACTSDSNGVAVGVPVAFFVRTRVAVLQGEADAVGVAAGDVGVAGTGGRFPFVLSLPFPHPTTTAAESTRIARYVMPMDFTDPSLESQAGRQVDRIYP